MIVHIGGDGFHLALIDVSRYESFVRGNWAQDDLIYRRLVEQGRKQCILAWATGFKASWKIELSAGISARKGFRHFYGNIRCSIDALHAVTRLPALNPS